MKFKISLFLCLILLSVAVIGMMTGCNAPQAADEKQTIAAEGTINETSKGSIGPVYSNCTIENLGLHQLLGYAYVRWNAYTWIECAQIVNYYTNEWKIIQASVGYDEDEQAVYLIKSMYEESDYVWYLCWPQDPDDNYPMHSTPLYWERIRRADESYYYQRGYFPTNFYYSITGSRWSNAWYYKLGCWPYTNYNVSLGSQNVAVPTNEDSDNSYWRWSN